jgi:hypothetical protein
MKTGADMMRGQNLMQPGLVSTGGENETRQNSFTTAANRRDQTGAGTTEE